MPSCATGRSDPDLFHIAKLAQADGAVSFRSEVILRLMVIHENNAMRREALFSRDGFYSFVVRSNALLHSEAVETGIVALRALLDQHSRRARLSVLDLACGGEPIAIAKILAAFPECQFDYHGVDINPDQVQAAREFAFPPNVVSTRIDQASAWDLTGLSVDRPYDLVFMGMNLHHGTPEEILFLAGQLRSVMSARGLFMNHDWFRPDHEPYQRRPDHNPEDPSESFRLVEPVRLAQAPAPRLVQPAATKGAAKPSGESDWRTEYRELLRQRLLDHGADSNGARATADHVASRDYPISLQEFAQLFQQENFHVHALHYQGDDPLKRYIAMPIASPDAAVVRRLQRHGG